MESPDEDLIGMYQKIKDIDDTATPAVKALFGMLPEELKGLMEELGQKSYRAGQLAEALYRQRVTGFEEMTALPVALREELEAQGYGVGMPELVQTARSVDGTERYLVRLADGETVETVWMPDGDGGERGDGSEAAAEEEAAEGLEGNAGPRRDMRNVGALERNGYSRATICISSQVGCAVNCQFCLTAKLGIKRNLTAGEIAGQVAAVLNRHGVKIGRDRINLVFMGMGEPFLNYAEFIRSVHLLVKSIGIPESRMTVSTSGIEPSIRKFAEEPLRPKLALSLNASNDVVREQVMPITRKWNIAALLEAVQTLPLGKREWVTFEYVLLGGINDQPEHAREVLELLQGKKAKVNLIVWNPGPGIDYHQPKPEDVAVFQKLLIDGGLPAYIRRPRGRDIYAACGQLKRTVESSPVAGAALVEIAPAASPRG
jgi:23S rRNA (adenine2503-C2)-methyltransferase